MADKLLKSITFPDLTDKYIVGDTTLSVAGAGADAKATGDALATKANIDGSYEDFTAGTANQINTSVRANDKTPYIFRTSGGSVDIGDREYVNGIVGGTVAWNQLSMGDFASNSPWVPYNSNSASASISDNVATVTITSTPSNVNDTMYHDNFYRNSAVVGHKYMVSAKLWSSVNATMGINSANYGPYAEKTIVANTWTDYCGIGQAGRTTMYGSVSVVSYSTAQVGQTYKVKDFMIFDLTQMFGSTIADYIASLETANVGAGVAWFKKLFNKPYYAYNAGELKSVSGLVSHDTVGFNAWDEEWRNGYYNQYGTFYSSSNNVANKNMIPILPNTAYYLSVENSASGGFGRLCFYDADGVFVSTKNISGNKNYLLTTPSDAYYMNFDLQSVYGTIYKNDICINIAWDNSRNGEYEPYVKHSYPLDSDLTLRGIPKLDADNKLYYDGDTYEADGTVTRKYGTTVLNGTQACGVLSSSNGKLVQVVVSGLANAGDNDIAVVSDKFPATTSNIIWSGSDSGIALHGHDTASNRRVWIRGTGATTDAEAQTYLTNNPITIVYELATPTTETADPYVSPQIVDDFGTEEFVIDSNTFAVPVGHDTDYPINMVAKLEMAPNSPDGDGDYIVRQTNGMNSYVPLVIEDALPTMPSEAGTYKLTVTVTEGSDPVLSWEAE